MPLVTTRHGARGLEEGAGSAFLVADEPQAFAAAVSMLAADAGLRAALSQQAARYAQSHFSPEAAFAALIDLIREGSTVP